MSEVFERPEATEGMNESPEVEEIRERLDEIDQNFDVKQTENWYKLDYFDSTYEMNLDKENISSVAKLTKWIVDNYYENDDDFFVEKWVFWGYDIESPRSVWPFSFEMLSTTVLTQETLQESVWLTSAEINRLNRWGFNQSQYEFMEQYAEFLNQVIEKRQTIEETQGELDELKQVNN